MVFSCVVVVFTLGLFMHICYGVVLGLLKVGFN